MLLYTTTTRTRVQDAIVAEITGLNHGRMSRPCGSPHGWTVSIVPPCQVE